MNRVCYNYPSMFIKYSDLKKWDKEDVQKWILWAIREYYGLCLDLLEISGRELCDLNIIQFKERVPDLAVFFFNELQIWKKGNGCFFVDLHLYKSNCYKIEIIMFRCLLSIN